MMKDAVELIAVILEPAAITVGVVGLISGFWSLRSTRERYYKEYKKRKNRD